MTILHLLLIIIILTMVLYFVFIFRPAKEQRNRKRRKLRRGLKKRLLYEKQKDFFNLYLTALINDI